MLLLNSIISLLVVASSAAFPSNEERSRIKHSSAIIEEGKVRANDRQTEGDSDGDGCYFCSRLGTSMVPEVRPLSGFGADDTCGDYQDKVVGLKSGSAECFGQLDFFDHRCCVQPSPLQSYECETNVRSSIIKGSYDAAVAPIHSVNGTLKALEVETYIVFFAAKEVDVQTSTLEIFLSISLSWTDPRLRWDSSNNSTCARRINVRADHSAEETEIWVPSLDLANRADSDFPAHKALVTPDGRVKWDRLGSLTGICSFVGLRRMPFDDLGCRLMFIDYDGAPIDYVLGDTGNNLTKGFVHWDLFDLSYSEFSIVDEKSRTKYGYTPNTFELDLFFHRARRHYVMFTLLPNILFTYISFGQFSFKVSEGDRLSFSITIVLIIVTQSILTASLLPVCSELLWLNAFNLVSMLFTLFGIVESLILFLLHRLFVSKKEEEKEEKEEAISQDVEERVNLIPGNIVNDADQEEIVDSGISASGDTNKDKPRHQDTSLTSVSGIPDAGEHRGSSYKGQYEAVTDFPCNNTQSRGSTYRSAFRWQKIGLVKAFTTKPTGVMDMMERIDLFCFITLPLAYTIYVIVMCTNNEKWEDDPEVRWRPF